MLITFAPANAPPEFEPKHAREIEQAEIGGIERARWGWAPNVFLSSTLLAANSVALAAIACRRHREGPRTRPPTPPDLPHLDP